MQVVDKVIPVDENISDQFWTNDTVEVFRVCPAYGTESYNDDIIVIGRNFRESDVLMCRYSPCTGTTSAPRQCTRVSAPQPEGQNWTVEAAFVSPTRVRCPAPEYMFPTNVSLIVLDGVCKYDGSGALAYIQACEADAVLSGSCGDDAGVGRQYVYDSLVRR